MQTAPQYAGRGRLVSRRRAREVVARLAARLLAISALLLAAYIVGTVVLEAREPSAATPQARPLPPPTRGGQAAALVPARETGMLALALPAKGQGPR